jgi:hypothetical protein
VGVVISGIPLRFGRIYYLQKMYYPHKNVL